MKINVATLAKAKTDAQQLAIQIECDSSVVDTVLAHLREAQAAAPPAVKAQIAQAASKLEATQQSVAALDSSLRRSIAVQDSMLARVAPTEVAPEGWILLGRVDEGRTQWDPRSPQAVDVPPAALLPGRPVRLVSDVYLRGASRPLGHAQAPILDVLARGETVDVISRDSSHALTGGWFLWSKVRRPSPGRPRSPAVGLLPTAVRPVKEP
jgi:hypothetical protein